MSDRYVSFAASTPGRAFLRRLGLPVPPRLRRYRASEPLVPGPVLFGGDGRLGASLGKVLASIGVELRDPAARTADGETPPPNAALIFDATGLTDSGKLRALFDFFHPYLRSLYPSGRVIVVGTRPAECTSAREATAQRALEGFVRSVGKELRRGGTANLVYASGDAELETTLRFLLSAKSAYVSGQVIHVGPAQVEAPGDWDKPLEDKVALVTGAARGIGAAIAATLARDGAHVVCLDVPATGDALARIANDLAGTAYQLDITGPDAPARLAEHLEARHDGIDIVVHNAGITRDKTLAKMSPEQWEQVLDVNLVSQERINAELLAGNLIPVGGRIIAVASVTGIAGNRGQANYAASKAGVIGLVESMAGELASRGIAINAVAPGFIETAMTARMPLFLREAGRRMNSMAQGGLPVDVAETVGYFASPGSAGVTGNVLRVCGQSLIGA
ncbi:MAG: 3-oxoacyl-ACP reductase [Actinobacteria bacterium 13_2_20CM_2_71_6]|nr:MAG: 3-oxoacyl-ACP reductase [Actinobacteria bacterium 13_2_20CM_2_71_6]